MWDRNVNVDPYIQIGTLDPGVAKSMGWVEGLLSIVAAMTNHAHVSALAPEAVGVHPAQDPLHPLLPPLQLQAFNQSTSEEKKISF